MEKQNYQWTDATTYSRGQTDKTPIAWQYNTPDLWIWISNGHRYHRNEWVVTCHALAIDAVVMRAGIDTPLADVQAMAIRIVKRRLSNMLTNIEPPTETKP